MVDRSTAQTPDGSDFLELQKAALSSMKDVQESSSVVGSISISGTSYLLELQKVALSIMKDAQKSYPPAASTSALSPVPLQAEDKYMLEWQDMAQLSMNRTTKSFVEYLNVDPDKRTAQSSHPTPASSTLHAIASTWAPQQDGESNLWELQKAALRSLRSITYPPSSAPAPEQAKGRRDSLKLRKIVPISVSNHEAPSISQAIVTQQTTGGDLLELQKLALSNIKNQTTYYTVSRHVERGAYFQDLRKKNLPSIPRPAPLAQYIHLTPPVHIQQTPKWTAHIHKQGREGGDLMELRKGALAEMSYGNRAGHKENVMLEDPVQDTMRNQQFDPEEGGATSSSSSLVLNEMSTMGPLENLLQKLSSKDRALKCAKRTIAEKDQRLREYETSLTNVLNLLECLRMGYIDAKVEEASKVLTEIEEIFGSLRITCNAVEYFLERPHRTITTPNNSQFVFHTTKGLDANQVEISDEGRNLVEELLRELGNIGLAQKEVQLGLDLQIERYEQLISELQQLDKALLIDEEAICDHDENTSAPEK